MNKNTGDGELKKILTNYLGTSWRAYEDGLIDYPSLNKAKAAIKKYAAQEANKAQQKLLQELMEQIPSKPKEADKTPKPILRRVEEGFGFGDVGGVVNTTEDTGFTYTEQDQENAAFECAQPYLEEVISLIQNKLEGLS